MPPESTGSRPGGPLKVAPAQPHSPVAVVALPDRHQGSPTLTFHRCPNKGYRIPFALQALQSAAHRNFLDWSQDSSLGQESLFHPLKTRHRFGYTKAHSGRPDFSVRQKVKPLQSGRSDDTSRAMHEWI
jgi:hypothetical protein